MSATDRVTLTGSDREVDPRHSRVGDVDAAVQIEVTVYVRPRTPVDWVDEEAERAPDERRRLEREDWAGAHGASADDLAAVEAFASQHQLKVVDVDSARRSISLRGTIDALAGAFGVEDLGLYKHPSGVVYRGRRGSLTIPSALSGVVTGVFGIDDRPQAEPRFRLAPRDTTTHTPVQVAEAYGFPPGVNGRGQTAGIIELGGGFNPDDLTTYFERLGLSAPSVTAVSVDGARNFPGVDLAADTEVALDIEVIGAAANEAAIVVYFAPNTDKGFIDAVSTAVHDAVHKPSVISISWGKSEDEWSAQASTQMEQVLIDAAGLGITVTVASGDDGSRDRETDGHQHVDFPASAPHALACGGTSLHTNGCAITGETVWNNDRGATGGGVSRVFALPGYQTNAGVPAHVETGLPGRGVPDVAGDADPDTGYSIRVDGSEQTVGGTSAVAPLWAALAARMNQLLGQPVGFLHPQLYKRLGTSAFRDITSGNNGAYSAAVGWDACTGLGSPNAPALTGIGVVDRSGEFGAPRASVGPTACVNPGLGVKEIVYPDASGHLQELWRDALDGTGIGELSASATAAGYPFAYVDTSRNIVIVLFRDSDGVVQSLYWSTGTAGNDNLSGTAGAPPAAGDPVGYYVPGADMHHVVYRGGDGHLHELDWVGVAPVVYGGNLTGTISAPKAAGNPSAFVNGSGVNIVVYRSTAGEILSVYWSDGPSGLDELSSVAGTPAAAGDPVAYYTAHDDTHQVVYLGNDGHLWELYWPGVAPVAGWNLTAPSGAPAAVGTPAAYYSAGTNTKHVIYRSSDGQLHELWWVPGGGTPAHVNITASYCAPAAADRPAAFTVDGPNTQHVAYRATDDHIYEVRWR